MGSSGWGVALIQVLYFEDRTQEDGEAKIYPLGADLAMVIDIIQAIKRGTPVFVDPEPMILFEGRRDR